MSRALAVESGNQLDVVGASAVLEIEDLKTHFFTASGVVKAVDGVSYAVRCFDELPEWIDRWQRMLGRQREGTFGIIDIGCNRDQLGDTCGMSAGQHTVDLRGQFIVG